MPDKWDRFVSKKKQTADQWDRFASKNEVATAPTPEQIGHPQTAGELDEIMTRLHGAEKPGLRDYLSTLQREGSAITSIPGGIYHSFADPETPEETKFRQQREKSGTTMPNDPLTRGLNRMVAQPVENAAEWYKKLLQGKIPNAREQALDVAPEAIGGAAGSVLLGKAMSSATGAVAKSTAPMTPSTALSLIRKGVLPKDPDFMSNLVKNLDTLKSAPEITSKAQMADFLEKTGTAHRGLYEQLLKPHENSTVAAKQIKGYQGEMVGDERGSATLRQLDSRLNVINNTIRDAKAGASGGPLSTQGIAPLKAEARAIRQVLYPTLQKLTGVDPAPIHAKMGQLNDLARQVRDSEIARFNQLNRPIDAPDTTKAALTSRVAGKAQRAVFGEPQDAAIRKAFAGLRRNP